MARSIRMPSQEELPTGARRRFMEMLFRLWVDADMPIMEKVSEAASATPPQEGAASKETVRKMLTGKTVPHSWKNAEAVFLGLSAMAGRDPDRLVVYDDDSEGYGYRDRPDPEPARMLFRRCWADACGLADYQHGTVEDYVPPKPTTRGRGGFGGGYNSDEPPF
ncbi:hypothetical protein [Nocardiopsis ansamitocini]|uniref:Uncharacterized protein n=1 Tax=Nocardiopsis ansamitocini TaxID=1670832 RepID=A0A9W6P5M3_9ACTN|nr:hypothetical protein [Nocardiopsis ansamitocini]GLU47517.1 hypothetical protein Nans01_18680 [Nocardiopsis ansamitocini]